MTDRLSRRRFLLAGGALGLATSCSSSSAAGAADAQLVNLFSPDHVIAAGRRQRIPFAVIDNAGLDLADGVELPVRVLFDGVVIEELTVLGRVVNHDHVSASADPDHQHADLLRYFALRTSLPNVGVYDLEVDFGNGAIGRLPVQSFDPTDVTVVLSGEQMPLLQTPTFDDGAGVNPICTRAPEPCPFHATTVTEALDAGSPLALLVATPALCQTAYCGPVLETLIAEAPDFSGITAIHLELYANANEVDGNYADPRLEVASQVAALGLSFEPSLFLVDGSGQVVDRIDNVFDGSELRAGLDSLL